MNLPVVRIFEWDTAEIVSPQGTRTTPGGSFAFKQIVSSGCETADPNLPATTSGIIAFEKTRFDITEGTANLPSHIESKVTALTFNLANSGVAISDMRIYLINESALQGSVTFNQDPGFVQFAASGSSWIPNAILPSGAGTRLTTTVPISRNVKRQNGGNALVGNDDQNSSEFVYMNVVLPLGYPLGNFGVCGSGILRFGLIFNYWSNDYILQFGDVG